MGNNSKIRSTELLIDLPFPCNNRPNTIDYEHFN